MSKTNLVEIRGRKTGGRWDRLEKNISTDIEELLDIPISIFKKIP